MPRGKNFYWRLDTPRQERALDEFVKLSAVTGKGYSAELLALLEERNRQIRLSHTLGKTKLVNEAELLVLLKEKGTPVSRRTLWLYRGLGRLKSEGPTPHFYVSPDKCVIYHLERCLSFFKPTG